MFIFYKYSSKGFTLIELVISLALAGIILSIILSILISNISMFQFNDIDIELQQQGQFIIGFLEDKIIGSVGIEYLQDINGVVKHETNEKVILKKIIFKNVSEAADKGYIFQLSKDPDYNYYNLKYGIGLSGTPTVEVGNFIEKIEVEPIPLHYPYTEAKGLSLEILFNFGGNMKAFRTQISFRNHFRRYE